MQRLYYFDFVHAKTNAHFRALVSYPPDVDARAQASVEFGDPGWTLKFARAVCDTNERVAMEIP